ncbi:recombinase [Prevotella sp. HMSC069G02]|jgi:plasmid recombination enzyme|nr:recombinase [Prevotella sp. HMSC069G02]
MTQKTSVHIKPCNIGQSEAHNQRTKEYLAHINASKIYVRQDLIPLNQSWLSEQQEQMNLQQYYDAIGRMVKEKTGRAMQTKERERVNKKTGKVIKFAGCTPLREGVVVCKEDTTMEQLKHFSDLCQQRFGITALQIHIHKDEGHYQDPQDTASWRPNYHAHIIWDWMNHNTGKSYKLDADDISTLQDLAAEALGMDRGVSKSETNKQHLERNDFIVAKQKREVEEAKAKKAELEKENKAKAQQSEALDKEIEQKQQKANRENGNAILSGLANLAGKGKYAQLEAENIEMKKQVAQIPQVVAQQVESLTSTYKEEIAKEQKRADFWLEECNKQERIYKGLLTKSKNREENLKLELQQRDQTIETMKAGLTDFLSQFTAIWQNAIKAVIQFARDTRAQFFTFSQASAVNDFLTTESHDRRSGADILITFTRPFLNMFEHEKGKVEINNVVDNFDWYNERQKLKQQEEVRNRPRFKR